MADKLLTFRRDTGLIDEFGALIPAPPSSNLWGWWNASYAYTDSGKTTLCSSSGSDTCYTLADLSGSGNDLIQATSANRPTWYSNELNSLPALRFDGSNDGLAKTSISVSQPVTLVFIWKTRAYDANQFYSGSTNLDLYYTSGNALRIASSWTDTTTLNTSNYFMAFVRFNGASSLCKINNSASSTGDAGSDTITYFDMGFKGAAYSQTNVCEWFMYTAALDPTTGDGLSVRQFLNTKYALGLGI